MGRAVHRSITQRYLAGICTNFSIDWLPKTTIIVAIANASDISMANTLG
jgi:hypothetical protein